MQQQLYDNFSNGAIFSPCKQYRYQLWRIWDDRKPLVMFIGLNPSRADESKDDPTIKRVRAITDAWGYGGFYMVNLFGLITPYPEELAAAKDPLGENDEWIREALPRCSMVIAAWGNFRIAQQRAGQILQLVGKAEALAINQNGTPQHPLYIPKNTMAIPYYPTQKSIKCQSNGTRE